MRHGNLHVVAGFRFDLRGLRGVYFSGKPRRKAQRIRDVKAFAEFAYLLLYPSRVRGKNANTEIRNWNREGDPFASPADSATPHDAIQAVRHNRSLRSWRRRDPHRPPTHPSASPVAADGLRGVTVAGKAIAGAGKALPEGAR